MIKKRIISHISAVGIFYRESNPSEIFIEMKDDGHPIKAVRRQLCPIGGNWVGKGAKKDIGPYETFVRDVTEELSFTHPRRESVRLSLLGLYDDAEPFFLPTKRNDVVIDKEDEESLNYIKSVITSKSVPLGDFCNTYTKKVMDEADQANERSDFTTLVSYFTVGFSEEEWEILVQLQKKFGNLSNESVTLITSLEEIIALGTHTSFAHDRVLKYFFLEKKCNRADELPIVEGLISEFVGESKASYQDYQEYYTILKQPK